MAEAFDLPMAPIQRLIKQALPPSANVSKEVKQSFSKAAALFVLYLTHTSNEMCRNANRTLVNADDVLAAIEEMEFEMFLDPLQEYLKEFREETQKKKKARSGGVSHSIPVDGEDGSTGVAVGPTSGKKRRGFAAVAANAAAAAAASAAAAAVTVSESNPSSTPATADGRPTKKVRTNEGEGEGEGTAGGADQSHSGEEDVEAEEEE